MDLSEINRLREAMKEGEISDLYGIQFCNYILSFHLDNRQDVDEFLDILEANIKYPIRDLVTFVLNKGSSCRVIFKYDFKNSITNNYVLYKEYKVIKQCIKNWESFKNKK